MFMTFRSCSTRKCISGILPVLSIFFISALSISCGKDNSASDEQYEIKFDSVNVALYIDNSIWPNCITYTAGMLNDLRISYTKINRDSIKEGALKRYNVLLMPGGNNYEMGQELGSDGIGKVRNYIKLGGGYFGVCGGAFFAASTSIWRGWSDEQRTYIEVGGLGIIGGIADGPVEDFAPSYQDFSCKINIISDSHPVAEGLPETIQYLYDHGPMFITGDDPRIEVIGRSVRGERNFILCSEFYKGRIFITSGHPEADYSKSSWPMVVNAMNWCSKRDLYGGE